MTGVEVAEVTAAGVVLGNDTKIAAGFVAGAAGARLTLDPTPARLGESRGGRRQRAGQARTHDQGSNQGKPYRAPYRAPPYRGPHGKPNGYFNGLGDSNGGKQ